MRAKLPEGFVDHVRSVALDTEPGGVLVLRMGDDSYTLYRAESFFAKLLLKLDDVLARGVQADLLVMVGRRDKHSGVERPPALQVREWS